MNCCVPCLRYKDNPFTAGDSFASRWDSDTASSFTSSWALEKEEPKESEVTISSIQPIGERFVHDIYITYIHLHFYPQLLILQVGNNWSLCGENQTLVGCTPCSLPTVNFVRLESLRTLNILRIASLPGCPVDESLRQLPQWQNPVRPGRSLPMPRPSPLTCSSDGRPMLRFVQDVCCYETIWVSCRLKVVLFS